MASVLLHTRSPLAIIEECGQAGENARNRRTPVPDIEGSPVCRLNPTRENKEWDT